MKTPALATLAGASLLLFGFTLPTSAIEEGRHSDNITEVARIDGTGGTDLEFFARDDLETIKLADGGTRDAAAGEVRHFAMVGNQNEGAKIVDITDPTAPYVVASLGDRGCIVGQGDIQVTDDGLVAAIAFASGGCKIVQGDGSLRPAQKGSILVDLSDPYDPVPVGNARESAGSHNNTITPDGNYLYISTSGIAEAEANIPIYDITDPTDPTLVQVWNTPGNSPHDIRFSPDGTRAYMAGVSQYRVVDTSDIENPQLISVIAPPGGSIGHDTLITADGAYLFLGDEGGGGAPYPCPGGAVYVYDMTVEEVPLLLGAVEADAGPVTNRQLDEAAPGGVGGCTAHVMDLNPDGTSFTLGWYTAGSRVFDFSGLYDADGNPQPDVVAAIGGIGNAVVQTAWIVPEGANTWAAKQYEALPGYVFSDDINLGFYVSQITDES